ncbi:Kef-type K+ transport system membrane component KefB [Stackebrandtia endophytica]|uniref:Kef-type K+ transport system membrane component KefB n=1 Tax=Stackebrandtia endophytica TaxID=1496996 RepID=A0A543AYZ2_9ACTN|nr:cation:proton antiporter [Stackebrandtia endophytica]TQL77793.1 Kef-type K+ transport system membrane component KefB [Stackebrandtia endophytica]
MAHSFAMLLLAFISIMVLCQIMHVICRAIGQPVVIGEIIAGVLLGPSLIGTLFPNVSATLFPPDLLSVMGMVSQLGLVLFMFTVGLEFSVKEIRSGAKVGIGVSLTGIAVPMVLGVGFALTAHEWVPLFPDGISITTGAVYLGLLLAITAFPVLARILTDRGISSTRYGTLSLAAGAIDDVLAWILLAIVLAMAGATSAGGIWIALGGLAVLAAVLPFARRGLQWALNSSWSKKTEGFVVAFLAMLVTAWFTESIGIHAVVGAFALGVVMPRGETSEKLITVIRPVTVWLFLPLFFAYTGLQTNFLVLDNLVVIAAGLVVVVFAFVGKLATCTTTARLMGESWDDSLRIGFLMNTRGLMQLIALNVGMQAGLVTPTLFAIIVIVAILTTLAAAPGLEFIDRRAARRARRAPDSTAEAVETAVG